MANSSHAAAADAAGVANQLPIFFQKPVPLDLRRHDKAGLLPSQDFSFARATNSILINAQEMVETSRYYPIIFTQDELTLPAVIVGLEKQNYFVDAKGRWTEGTYIPAYVRRYPFVFMDIADKKQLALCIDEGAANFRKNGGKGVLPLYEGENPSPLTRHALEFCTAFQSDHLVTRRFCEDVKAAGLLVPNRSTAKLSNGREINLTGFQIIDENKVNALADETILEFHKKGWLPIIYCALMSTSNWKRLADMAGKHELSSTLEEF
jgi:hypothetical protein